MCFTSQRAVGCGGVWWGVDRSGGLRPARGVPLMASMFASSVERRMCFLSAVKRATMSWCMRTSWSNFIIRFFLSSSMFAFVCKARAHSEPTRTYTEPTGTHPVIHPNNWLIGTFINHGFDSAPCTDSSQSDWDQM